MAWRTCGWVAMVGCLTFGASSCRAPMAGSGQPGITDNATLSARLAEFAARDAGAALEVFGRSAGGRPLEVLRVGDFSLAPTDPARPLTFLLVGTQHGMEPSGGEALLQLADELTGGAPDGFLRGARFLLVPNFNPDGRDRNRRVNAAQANLSTDFSRLSQPESRALVRLLDHWRPDAVLDLHESAIWKKQTLGAQGYLLDFEAQFETGNHPAVAPPIRELCFTKLLPEILAATVAAGVPAQRYLGEITRLDQPLTHGGLSLRNLRNYAALRNCVSFLVENRLDPSNGTYPTPRNLRERTRKQYCSLRAFLQVCLAHRAEVRTAVAAARQADLEGASWPLAASAEYVQTPGAATLTVMLRRIADGKLEARHFPDHSEIKAGISLPAAEAYRITARSPQVAAWLLAQGFEFGFNRQQAWAPDAPLQLPAEGEPIMVPLRQPGGRLAALLLDPDSAAAIWHTPEFQGAYASPPAARLTHFPENP